MIAIPKKKNAQSLHAQFEEMLPAIRRQARLAFRGFTVEQREELTAEVIAGCWVAFVRLAERGKLDVVYPTPLAMYAIKQVRSGRSVGSRMNGNDVLSGSARKRNGIKVERLDRGVEWRQIIVENRKAGPAETAASRIDFSEWLKTLNRRQHRIVKVLAGGETTKEAARRFRVTAGRISQVRRELEVAWERFQGEESRRA